MNENYEARLSAIEERNKRVDANKRWETSWVRRGSIALLTYLTIVAYHIAIGADRIWIISAVPVLGFLLSTLSLHFIRTRFEKNEKS